MIRQDIAVVTYPVLSEGVDWQRLDNTFTDNHYGRMSTTITRSAKLAEVRRKCISGEAKQIRVDANVSVSEIADDVGVTPNAIWAWENCRRSPQGEPALIYGKTLTGLTKRAL
jgi:DNA-binding transcriptional regulator YiaG